MNLIDIYKEAHAMSHEAGLSAVYEAGRQSLASELAGVDIATLQAENAALKEQIIALTPKPEPVVEPTETTVEPNAGPNPTEGTAAA